MSVTDARGPCLPLSVMPPESAAQVPSAAEALAAAEAAVRAQAERAAAARARAKAAREAAELEAAAHAAQLAEVHAAQETADACYSYSELSEQVHAGSLEEHGLAGRADLSFFDRSDDLSSGSLPDAQGREEESERSPEACTVFNRALRVLPDDAEAAGALVVPEDDDLDAAGAGSIGSPADTPASADALSPVAPDHSVELLGEEEEPAKSDAPRSTTPVSLNAPAESSGQDDAAESTPSPHASPAAAGTPVPPSSLAATASPEARRSPASPAESRRSTPSRRARSDHVPVAGATSNASTSKPLTHAHGAELVGKRIDVWWAAEERWYEGRVAEFNQVSGRYAIVKVERTGTLRPDAGCCLPLSPWFGVRAVAGTLCSTTTVTNATSL